MPLTVATALSELPSLSSAIIVAGRSGLDRVIVWSHIVDNPEICPWVREGVLLLTTMFAINKDQVEQQREIIKYLANMNLSGVIISVGRYIQKIPPCMLDEAEKHNFPIITVPWDVPFIELTREIHEWIHKEQFATPEQALRVQRELTQIVIGGGGLSLLAEKLAIILQNSIIIESVDNRLLAHYPYKNSDGPYPQYFLEQMSAKTRSYFEASGLLDFSNNEIKVRHIAPNPKFNISSERILAPIVMEDHLSGFLWIVNTNGPLDIIDYSTIEHAAFVAALIMSRDKAVYEAELRGKKQLFDNLISSDQNASIYDLQKMMRGLGLHGDYQILLIQEYCVKKFPVRLLSSYIESSIKRICYSATVLEWDDRIVVMLGGLAHHAGEKIAHQLIEEGKKHGMDLLVGMSSVAKQTSELKKCLHESLDSLEIGLALCKGMSGVWVFDQLGFLSWLINLPTDTFCENEFGRIVENIDEYDRQNNTEYLRTLETYLDNLLNSKSTADNLYLHRNTLHQRLSKLQSLWQIDFTDMHSLVNIYISIKAHLVKALFNEARELKQPGNETIVD